MHTNTEVFINQDTTARTHLGRVAWIDQDDTMTSIFRFVRRVLNQLAPRCVCDAFGKAMVGKHSGCVQVLKDDQPVVVGQLSPDLMSKVAAAVGNPFVYLGYRMAAFGPQGRTLFSLRQSALRAGQGFFVGTKEPGVRYFLAVRQGSEAVQPHIYTNCLPRVGLRHRLDLAREASIPIAGSGAPDGERLDLPFNRAMQHDLDRADFGQVDAPVFAVQREAKLRVRPAIVAAAPTEAWISRRLARLHPAKEGFESQVYPFLGILQRLGVGNLQGGAFFLPLCQQTIRGIQVEAFPAFLPCHLAYLQRLVVDPTASIQGLLKEPFLGLRGIQPIAEGTQSHSDAFLISNVGLHDFERDRTVQNLAPILRTEDDVVLATVHDAVVGVVRFISLPYLHIPILLGFWPKSTTERVCCQEAKAAKAGGLYALFCKWEWLSPTCKVQSYSNLTRPMNLWFRK